MTAIELRQEKAKIVHDMRSMLDAAEKENRGFNADENTKYQAMEKAIDGFDVRIKNVENAEARAREMAAPINEPIKPTPVQTGAPVDIRATDEYRNAFRSYLTTGRTMGLMDKEGRALQMDSDTKGGYTVAPQQFVNQLIKDLDNATFVRGLATKFSVPNAESIGAPTLDNDPADPTWTGEITTRSEDSTMSFGKRELRPHPLAKLLKVSKKLVRASAMDIENLVRSRLAYKLAVVEENAFLNGTGNQQPLGVFVASAHGINTGQDVSTGNTATEIKFDGLIEAKYTLKQGYLANARWIFHRDGVKQIRKLKDGEGRYIWEASVQAGQPDRILNIPVLMSEYAPNTFTTTKYVGILGDFSYYWIADALDISLQVLVELYAATNQNGYIVLKETDGMPVLENAFARVKLG